MNTYLITGAAGFIGSNFVRYLYEQEPDAKVRVLDKLTYAGNLVNLKDFEGNPNFEFVKGDICDASLVNKLVADTDVIVNFAAESAVDRSIDDPEEFLRTDIHGVFILLEAARKKSDFKKFIQISTDEVYGHTLEGSFVETSECKPRNPYAASKLGGDRLAYSFYSTYKMPVVITRASNNYGPQAYLEKVIPLFITNLMEDKQVPVYGEGLQIRDWMYVTDHCAGIYHLVGNGVDGEVYNIGGNQEVTNIDLTRQILKLMDKDESYIKYVEDRPGHDFRYSLDCSKLQALGWKPQYTVEQGLEKTVEWYKNNEDWWRPVKEKMDQRYVAGFWGEKK